MSERVGPPAVFTPDNEPYLGLPSVLWFDRIIVWAMSANQRVAVYTHIHRDSLTDLQHAACQIIPQGINIALSIRELLRQAYLFPAQVLIRPLIERAAVISYLHLHPEAVSLWQSGWKHRERPSLATMMHAMAGARADPEEAKEIGEAHNHIVHGDPIGAYYSLINLPDGRVGYASGKILDNPEMCDAIAMEAQCYLIVVAGRMSAVFPGVEVPAMPGDPDSPRSFVH
jgi:hypothetical protein